MLTLAIALVLARIPWITVGSMRYEQELLALMRGHCFRSNCCKSFPQDTTWFIGWPSVYAADPVACCAISRKKGHYVLHNLCVHRDHRRQRWASALYQKAIAYCRRENLHRSIRVMIEQENDASRAVLASGFPGFERVRSTTAYDKYRMSW